MTGRPDPTRRRGAEGYMHPHYIGPSDEGLIPPNVSRRGIKRQVRGGVVGDAIMSRSI